MPLRGARHTTMTDDVHVAVCKHHTENPALNQAQLVNWLQDNYQLRVSQATVYNTVKRKADLLRLSEGSNMSAKRQRAVKYPLMESALLAWFTAHQDRINFSGDLVREHAERILDRLHPGHESFQFSNGWLESF